jgi:methyltransferase family protein
VEAAAVRAASSLGYELRRQHFYLPFPDVETLPESLWNGPRQMYGVDLRLKAAGELLESLRSGVEELVRAGVPIDNGSYESGDAETLYAMLRHLRPRRLIELGSGASTHLISLAHSANARDGAAFTFEGFDPYPGWHPMGTAPGFVTHPVAAEALDAETVASLAAGDVLFVDTTHTVKTGGDVVHIVRDMLPRIKPGVYVHFHDIFLPYEYPRPWVIDHRRAWAEQYLLEAFLAFNLEFEVVLPLHALWRLAPARTTSAIPSLAGQVGTGPGAFWIRRTSDPLPAV